MTNNARERVWTNMSSTFLVADGEPHWPEDVEYVRKDLYDAAIKDMRRSEAACYDWAEISQASYQRAKQAEHFIRDFAAQPIASCPTTPPPPKPKW